MLELFLFIWSLVPIKLSFFLLLCKFRIPIIFRIEYSFLVKFCACCLWLSPFSCEEETSLGMLLYIPCKVKQSFFFFFYSHYVPMSLHQFGIEVEAWTVSSINFGFAKLSLPHSNLILLQYTTDENFQSSKKP